MKKKNSEKKGIYITSSSGMVARGCTTRPNGMRQLLRRSLEHGTQYIVERMNRGLQLPGRGGEGGREGEGERGGGRGEGGGREGKRKRYI